MGTLNIQIDPDIHRRGKALASLQGVNWYDWVRAAIREKVERDEAKQRAALRVVDEG